MAAETIYILVVDDDERLRDLLGKFLVENGFSVSAASDASEARNKLKSLAFDVIVLDLMMPGESGLDFARSLRQTDQTPILMLTAMGEPEDRIGGLECGADDYLVKPFEPRELLLRINNIIKHIPAAVETPERVRLGDCIFDLCRGEMSRAGEPVRLTEQEVALLRALAATPGVILSRDELTARTGAAAGGRAVDVQVTRLRRKIERDSKLPRYLQTVRGRGYTLRPD